MTPSSPNEAVSTETTAEQPAGYVVGQALGMGALCETLRVRDAAGHALVLKRLHRHCANDPDLVAMFRHEGRVLAALDHPNVPRLVAQGLDGGRWTLAIAYVDGIDLAAVMAHNSGAQVAAGVAMTLQLLAALGHAHGRSDPSGSHLAFVHRDVAPANVVVDVGGTLTLIDWGLATSAWRQDPDRGRMKGTRGYMAPEVVTGDGVADARSDLFAVGVILYELTVGQRLYPGGSMESMMAIADGPVPSPAKDSPGYPHALDAVVQRALAKNAADRFQTAEAMASSLRTAARALGLPAGRDAVIDLMRAARSP